MESELFSARSIRNIVIAALMMTAAPALATPVVDKGDTAWMLISTALVLLMAVPGLAVFYGGMVRTKNMLSILTQVFMITCVVMLVWVTIGYSIAFTPGNAFWGGTSKAFLAGVTTASVSATLSNGVYIPEFTYIAFQMTFACVTAALLVGAFAERMKFTAAMLIAVGWVLLVYCPVAHMAWYWAGPDYLKNAPGDFGLFWGMGLLDFAGGTVVEINAGIAGLVGCIMVGKRIGYPREAMAPHSLVMTMIGASLLWVGWIGFNAGSSYEANGLAGLAMLNTLMASAAAAVSWMFVEQLFKGKPSLLGAVTGAVAGLVAITPAGGFASPMTSIVLGLVVAPVSFVFCSTVKRRLNYDDTLDVFGVHCIGGIIGTLGTAVVASPSLGGQGTVDYTVIPAVAGVYNMGGQLLIQAKAMAVTLLWSGLVSAALYYAVGKTVGFRRSVDDEREGLDLAEHGERAYNL